jgi:hypothetical protein
MFLLGPVFFTHPLIYGFVTGNHSSRTPLATDLFVGSRTVFIIGFGPCESAEAKRLYMVNNPVRAGLVSRPEEWPFHGEIFKNESWW